MILLIYNKISMRMQVDLFTQTVERIFFTI